MVKGRSEAERRRCGWDRTKNGPIFVVTINITNDCVECEIPGKCCQGFCSHGSFREQVVKRPHDSRKCVITLPESFAGIVANDMACEDFVAVNQLSALSREE